MSDEIETVEITGESFLADAKAANDLAEKVGRVVVKDADGRMMLIINSHRSTEGLLGCNAAMTNGIETILRTHLSAVPGLIAIYYREDKHGIAVDVLIGEHAREALDCAVDARRELRKISGGAPLYVHSCALQGREVDHARYAGFTRL